MLIISCFSKVTRALSSIGRDAVHLVGQTGKTARPGTVVAPLQNYTWLHISLFLFLVLQIRCNSRTWQTKRRTKNADRNVLIAVGVKKSLLLTGNAIDEILVLLSISQTLDVAVKLQVNSLIGLITEKHPLTLFIPSYSIIFRHHAGIAAEPGMVIEVSL